MFRLGMFVEDKHLVEVLKALNGRALNLDIQPVINAEADGKVVKAKAGSNLQLISDEIGRLGIKALSANILREVMTSLNMNAASYGYYMKELQESGRIKKTGKGNVTGYTVVST